jgi:hypothetical protein
MLIGYGQFAQDWFVNLMHEGKEGGFFVDIGCGTSTDLPADQVPIYTMSNSFGLEKYKNWKGVAIDCDPVYFEVASKQRNSVVCADLLETNINSILEEKNCPEHMDYLSFDVDAAQRKVFDEFNFDKYSFNVITYEHNYSVELEHPNSIHVGDKEYSRKRFYDLGYKLLFGNVGLHKGEMIEDWWVSPEMFEKHKHAATDPSNVIEIVKHYNRGIN